MDFDGLVDEYQKPVYNLIFRLLGDREEAADLTQETFVAAYKSFSSFRGESSAYTWLYRIAVNKCKNRFAKRDRVRTYEGLSLDRENGESSELAPGAVVVPERPDDALERKELRQRIAQAMMSLPPDYRIVAVLRDIQGLSYQEIAAASELSVDVVRTRLARARAMLRQKLAPYLEIK